MLSGRVIRSENPMFTKKHYEAIANIINHHEDKISKYSLTRELADLFDQDNERFNREKFLVACYKEHPCKE